MLTSSYIKQKAYELGATVCGIGSIDYFKGEHPQRDPKMILPSAKCIIGFGFAVPKGLYQAMENKSQYYTYTTVGTSCIDTEYSEVFLYRLGNLIEDQGYDACLQRAVPHLKIKGDKTTNPETLDTYELIYASPVSPDKPCPDVMIDVKKAVKACGLGSEGLSGNILAPKYGPYMRYAFIITDAPLEVDKPFENDLCDKCGLCKTACPGKAISDEGLDTWQCAVYYKGAGKDNPFIKEGFLQDNAEKQAILDGAKKFDCQSAREIYPQLKFLPHTGSGYSACLCGKKCATVCYNHLKEKGLL